MTDINFNVIYITAFLVGFEAKGIFMRGSTPIERKAELYFLEVLKYLGFHEVKDIDSEIPLTVQHTERFGIANSAGVCFFITLNAAGETYLMPLQLTLAYYRNERTTFQEEMTKRGEIALLRLPGSLGLLQRAARGENKAFQEVKVIFLAICRDFLGRQTSFKQEYIREMFSFFQRAEVNRLLRDQKKQEQKERLAKIVSDLSMDISKVGLNARNRRELSRTVEILPQELRVECRALISSPEEKDRKWRRVLAHLEKSLLFEEDGAIKEV